MKKFKLLIVIMFGLCSTTISADYGIIFDCDGILVDSEIVKYKAWQKALENYNIALTQEEYAIYAGSTGKATLANINNKYNTNLPDNIVAEKNVIYDKLHAEQRTPIPSMVDLVKHLAKNKALYGVKLAVASSARKKEVLANLQATGLIDCFDAIVSGKDDLEQYHDPSNATNKPKPYIYLEAARQLNIPTWQCYVFEDTLAGVHAGLQAGMKVFALPGPITKAQFKGHAFDNRVTFLTHNTQQCLNALFAQQQPITVNKKILLLTAGLPGVGKTTLAKELKKQITNCTYIDKDSINVAMLGAHSYQSDFYKSNVRFQSYDIMFNIAQDNLQQNGVVILDGMFGDKLSSDLLKPLFASQNFITKVIYCSNNKQQLLQQLITRADKRDNEKLRNFDQYYARENALHETQAKLMKHAVIRIDTQDELLYNISKIVKSLSPLQSD